MARERSTVARSAQMTMSEMQPILSSCDPQYALLKTSSECSFGKLRNTSNNMESLLCPALISAVEQENPHQLRKALEMGLEWITNCSSEMKTLKERFISFYTKITDLLHKMKNSKKEDPKESDTGKENLLFCCFRRLWKVCLKMFQIFSSFITCGAVNFEESDDVENGGDATQPKQTGSTTDHSLQVVKDNNLLTLSNVVIECVNFLGKMEIDISDALQKLQCFNLQLTDAKMKSTILEIIQKSQMGWNQFTKMIDMVLMYIKEEVPKLNNLLMITPHSENWIKKCNEREEQITKLVAMAEELEKKYQILHLRSQEQQ